MKRIFPVALLAASFCGFTAQAQAQNELDRLRALAVPLLIDLVRGQIQQAQPPQGLSTGWTPVPTTLDPDFRARRRNGYTPGPTAKQQEQYNKIWGPGGRYYDEDGLLRQGVREDARRYAGPRVGDALDDVHRRQCADRGIDCSQRQSGGQQR